jgi:nucleotide-binding universal stress UspA family protein
MKTILVPVDFSDVTEKVVDTAAQLAEAFESRIVLVHVAEPEPQFVGYDPGPMSVRVAVAGDIHVDQRRLEALKLKFSGTEVLALQVQGSIPEEILSLAQEHSATLIVMGSHGHGALYRLLVGSVANAVLKAGICPVLIVPSERPLPPAK